MNLFGLTDTGKVRADNQDSYAIRILDEDLAVAVVCDGMGGAQAGNVASAVAVEAFAAAVEEGWKQSPPRDGAQCGQLMRDACHRANQAVFGLSQTNPDYQGMGTTLVAVLLWGEEVTVVNVGDSRAYLLRQDGIRQITQDHSLVQALVNRGELTREQARVHPKKNLITRALGVEEQVCEDIFQCSAQRGDVLLLCSDGLSNELTDRQLLEACRQGSAEECCRRMLGQVLELGAPDNVTIVMAQL